LNLSAFMIATSDPGDYGDLTVYETPQGTPGPANADQYIQADHSVSQDITLYDQHGSEVLLGNTLMVPIAQSIIYLRPLYVASSTNPLPQLTDVIGVLGQKVVVESSVAQTLSDLLHVSVTSGGTQATPGTGATTVPAVVATDLATAQTDYNDAQAALAAGSLANYQSYITAMNQEIQAAQTALSAASPTTTTTTTTTTTPPKGKSKVAKPKTTTTTTASTTTTTTTTAGTTTTGPTTSTTLASAAPPRG
jgi:uncharacterized membrane protein (UPF0182 family)